MCVCVCVSAQDLWCAHSAHSVRVYNTSLARDTGGAHGFAPKAPMFSPQFFALGWKLNGKRTSLFIPWYVCVFKYFFYCGNMREFQWNISIQRRLYRAEHRSWEVRVWRIILMGKWNEKRVKPSRQYVEDGRGGGWKCEWIIVRMPPPAMSAICIIRSPNIICLIGCAIF